jgi:hypothetical protein
MPTELLGLTQYKDAEERQRAMEKLSIEVEQLKIQGKFICIPQMTEILNIYQQAEAEAASMRPTDKH